MTGDLRPCPYCHAPLSAEDPVHACEECGGVHHQDCWEEGGGCANYGCPAGRKISSSGGAGDGAGQVPPGGGRRRGRKLRAILVVGAVAVALAAAAAVFFAGGSEDGRGTPPTSQSQDSPSRAERLEAMEASLDRAQRKERRRETRFRRVFDPGGNWTARLPQGSKWTAPRNEGNQNTTDNPRYRTIIWGPDSSFVLVETTPSEDPVLNEANFEVDGVRIDSEPVPGPLSGAILEFEGATGDCADLYCAKAVLSDGYGGGVAVLAGSRSRATAKQVVARFVPSVRLDYLG